LEICKQSAVTS